MTVKLKIFQIKKILIAYQIEKSKRLKKMYKTVNIFSTSSFQTWINSSWNHSVFKNFPDG